jgi:hypothetical protein
VRGNELRAFENEQCCCQNAALHITEVGLSFYVVISWIQSASARMAADGPASELR